MQLKEKLGKEFVVTCELGGTQGTDIEKSLEDAKSLSRADGINLIDCAMARLRINTFALAHIIQKELDICCIPHLTRRDRSILALQADLLGAHCLGVRYVLATTGDAPQHGQYKNSTAVYNLNTHGLIKLINNMNNGLDYNGEEIKGKTEFFISATATPAAKNLDKEIELVKAKIDAGANFLQTQSVYSPDEAKRFIEKVEPLGAKVLLGVMPLKSAKMAAYLNENVPGIHVPEEVISSFEKYGSGIPVACEFIDRIRDFASGIHIMAMGNVENMNAIMDHVYGKR
ncbi:methylenetetrahydrofolate reductase [Candidatus Desantisbacteria bacterium]|nr:methylenetetrahydrofolate reductase [Candidatus Desantisbacteria bacterium]